MDKISKTEIEAAKKVLQRASEAYYLEYEQAKDAGNKSLKHYLNHQALVAAIGVLSGFSPAQDDIDAKARALRLAAEPLIMYLAKKHHPHVTAIVTGSSVELLEGSMSLGDFATY